MQDWTYSSLLNLTNFTRPKLSSFNPSSRTSTPSATLNLRRVIFPRSKPVMCTTSQLSPIQTQPFPTSNTFFSMSPAKHSPPDNVPTPTSVGIHQGQSEGNGGLAYLRIDTSNKRL